MARVGKDNDREDGKGGNRARPSDYVNLAAVCHSISLEEMGKNKDDEVGNRHQRYHAGIFERIETTKKRQGNDNEPIQSVRISVFRRETQPLYGSAKDAAS